MKCLWMTCEWHVNDMWMTCEYVWICENYVRWCEFVSSLCAVSHGTSSQALLSSPRQKVNQSCQQLHEWLELIFSWYFHGIFRLTWTNHNIPMQPMQCLCASPIPWTNWRSSHVVLSSILSDVLAALWVHPWDRDDKIRSPHHFGSPCDAKTMHRACKRLGASVHPMLRKLKLTMMLTANISWRSCSIQMHLYI